MASVLVVIIVVYDIYIQSQYYVIYIVNIRERKNKPRIIKTTRKGRRSV